MIERSAQTFEVPVRERKGDAPFVVRDFPFIRTLAVIWQPRSQALARENGNEASHMVRL